MKTNFVLFVSNNPIIVLRPYYWNKAGDRSSRVPLVKKIKKSRILGVRQNLNKGRHLKHQSWMIIAIYGSFSNIFSTTSILIRVLKMTSEIRIFCSCDYNLTEILHDFLFFLLYREGPKYIISLHLHMYRRDVLLTFNQTDNFTLILRRNCYFYK